MRRDGARLTRREWWREGTDARWGVGRLVCAMLLIPGPGISLLGGFAFSVSVRIALGCCG